MIATWFSERTDDSYPKNPGFSAVGIEDREMILGLMNVYRCMKQGQPFLMMESTPANVNWREVNKLPLPERQAQAAMLALAHGAASVQYFQWRKSRGGHEKFHGAVVDHVGTENTRVFRQVAKLGE